MLDLIKGGSDWSEIAALAKELESCGVDVINTGIGWHEARIPTIATMVPRGGFAFVTQKLKSEVSIPLVATNRFNTPETCEKALKQGAADMISMARPFLADPHLMKKTAEGDSDKINTCIGCNQACLDHLFEHKTASCLVNPRACEEGNWGDPNNPVKSHYTKVAVVGGGPAGMSCASELALLGYSVTLFEKGEKLGGQFNIAKKIPGKGEFEETIRYFRNRLEDLNVEVKLNTEANVDGIYSQDFKHVVIATGVLPRQLNLKGADRSEVVNYLDVLEGRVDVGEKVVIIGAGGIGFDVADYLSHDADNAGFMESWGVDKGLETRGGVIEPKRVKSKRQIHILQRSKGKPGAKLAKTTGWIHRLTMKQRGITAWGGVNYLEINEEGMVIEHPQEGLITIPVDNVIVCAGQIPFAPLSDMLKAKGVAVHLIGGSKLASGLDAKRAIREGLELATQLYNDLTSKMS
jgi:2,4-dienoyl-CoA reductase (NADPH2)